MQILLWDVKRIIFKVYDELVALKSKIESDITHTPGWIERRKTKSGNVVLYWFFYEGGKRKAVRIPDDKKEEVEKQIQNITLKKMELDNVKKQLRMVRLCMRVLKMDPTANYAVSQGKKERAVKFSGNVPYAENRRHPTMKGDMVRSKSEALLANLLYYHEIEYEYEKAVYIKGQKIFPDFTIHLQGGNVLYWEHLGMAGNPNYDSSWSQKSYIYSKGGISEGNGLIITRDVNGVFDELDALHKIELYQLSRR